MSSYHSGQCNIGRREIRKRRLLALIGAALTLFLSVGLVATKAARVDRISVLIPALIFALGLVQSAKRFCVAYGALGVYHFDADIKAVAVEDRAARRKDRNTALVIFLQSLVIAALVTLIVLLLP
jgi:hypothetical protein